MRKNQFAIHTLLSVFSGLCIIGVLALFLSAPSVYACNYSENDSAYNAGTFNNNDVAAVCCNSRRPNFSSARTLISGGNSAAYLLDSDFADGNFLSTANKTQAIDLYFHLSCEFIACTAPPRAGPVCL